MIENKCESPAYSCPLGMKSLMFITTYVFSVFLLLLNLLVGLVLEAYANQTETSSGLAEEDIDSFYVRRKLFRIR